MKSGENQNSSKNHFIRTTCWSRDLKHFEYNVLNKNSHVTKDKTSRVKYKI